MTSRKELGVLSRAETNPHGPDLVRQRVKSMEWIVEQVQSTRDDRFVGSGFNICTARSTNNNLRLSPTGGK
jgi:hypothetical protein